MSQINDTTLLDNDEDDSLKYRYLRNSIPKFHKCKKNLSARNEIEFEDYLSETEIMILGNLMVVEYYNPQINNLSLLKQSMSNKDFVMTSQANHLAELRKLKAEKMSEVNKLIVDYTYNNGDIGALR